MERLFATYFIETPLAVEKAQRCSRANNHRESAALAVCRARKRPVKVE